ncbi:peptide deformylase [Butyrivibrio sp. X503]|uniref:peptide deformylase n=1 Tax=Butyrivibrio sp. X503 TaxID=2364878 RepID=UPI000EA93E47|nr:peptide deformylase [Butyrivibrio sp. X503]RKM56478.1 peptide deformylase [Butyrivibrio sp. X503]
MALRTIREFGDEVLARRCKEVKEITPRIKELVQDMIDTMYEADGVGLAAPQVGVLKRIFVIDVSPEGDSPMVFINPEILETSGEQTGYEGCLSVPGKSGIVTRPNYVKAKATNLDGEEFVVEGEELFARAILHENDHLDGHMYVEKVEGELVNNEDLIAQNEEAQE